MKLLIKATGPHMYLDMTNGQEINAFRPSVVVRTPFIQIKLAAQDVALISADLKDEATDAEFAKYMKDSDGDVDLAVSAFLKAFNPVEEVVALVPKEAPAKAGK